MMTAQWRAAALVAALLAGGSVAHADRIAMPAAIGGDYSVPVTSLKEGHYKSTIRQQYDFSCGSAALATLLTYQYGYRVSEQAVFEEMFARGDQAKIKREGFSLLDIKLYLAAHGFQADGYEAPLDKLAATGLPAIALIKENGYNHFVVVKGLREGRVLIGDPSAGTRSVPRASFESMWTNGILFVVHNKIETARFNLEDDWRVAPRAPIGNGVDRNGLGGITLPKHGAGDF